jgi:hypothetical protein
MINRFRPFRAAALLLAVPALLSACKKDTDDPTPAAPGAMYVVNQGNFLRSNADITRFDRASGAVVRAQFATANPSITGGLGDVAQSMTVVDGKGYIVVNNSNKIVVVTLAVTLADFKQVAEIAGLEQPRYMAVYAGKGYVTEWGLVYGAAGRVSEIDLTTNTRTGRTFVVGVRPEEIVATTAGLLVANSGGASLTGLSPLLGTSTTAVPMPDGPTAVRLDGGGRLWVLCAGHIAYTPSFDIDTLTSTPGSLVSVPLTNLTAPSVRFFNRKGVSPGSLTFTADRSRLYYTYIGHVFTMTTADAALPRTAFLRRKAGFDALGVDPTDGTLYAADQRAFTGDGRVLRYRPSGSVIDSFSTAVGPTQFVF